LNMNQKLPNLLKMSYKQVIRRIFGEIFKGKVKSVQWLLRGLSPQANYASERPPLVGEVIANFCR
jgi:hypothetical protein